MKDKKYILKVTKRNVAFSDKFEYECADGHRLYALLEELLRLGNSKDFTISIEEVISEAENSNAVD